MSEVNGPLLRLFVTGSSQRSMRAIETVEALIYRHLNGQARLEVVDVLEHPERAEQETIIATPTLVRENPQPARRIVGDLMEPERLVGLLGLREYPKPKGEK
jgi:circadian clock protein KaiB